MFDSKKDPFLEPGSWNLWETGKRMVLFSCPECGQITTIMLDVLSNGVVSGPVKCARPWCDFFQGVKLLGWEPG